METRERIVVTVLGADKVGIVAGVTTVLAQHDANIIDLTSSKMRDLFVMLILIDITDSKVTLQDLQKALKKKGEELGIQVTAQHEDIFRYMHRV